MKPEKENDDKEFAEMFAKENPTTEFWFKDDLNALLKKAHFMLAELGIPIAPLEHIKVLATKRKGFSYVATCCLYDDKWLAIEINYKYELEHTEGKPQTLSLMLHELLHTCQDTQTGWHPEHDRQFMVWAEQIHEAYGYNVLDGTQTKNRYVLADKPVYATVKCPACLFSYTVHCGDYKEKKYIDKGIAPACLYCRHRMQIKRVESTNDPSAQ